jgi:hypothetical protein
MRHFTRSNEGKGHTGLRIKGEVFDDAGAAKADSDVTSEEADTWNRAALKDLAGDESTEFSEVGALRA